MHVVSLNVNGIRAAVRRGLLGWVAEKRPELICLQEIRATQSQLPLREFEQFGYESIWNLGSRPGYSGVGILSRIGFEPVVDLLDDPATEHEGASWPYAPARRWSRTHTCRTETGARNGSR